jgi:flagellar protein FliO/FliZ
MQWLNDLPFGDNRVLQIGLLAVCGIASLVVLAIVYRLVFAQRLRVPGGRTRQPRLGLVDAFSLDGQRQLVLVRRDNVEHLVMIGGPNDVLVESQINRALAPAREKDLAPTREKDQIASLQPPQAPGRRADTVGLAPPPAAARMLTVADSPPAAPVVAAKIAPAPTIASAPETVAVPAAPTPPAIHATVAAAKGPERGRPIPLKVQQPRPAPSRPAMPPPIVPANGSTNRATITRLMEKAPPKAAPTPPLAPAARSESGKLTGAAAKPETRAASATETIPEVLSEAPAQMPDAAKSEASEPTPSREAMQPAGDISAPASKGDLTGNDQPPPKADDPLADLDSLEAEMARLLGRDKLG